MDMNLAFAQVTFFHFLFDFHQLTFVIKIEKKVRTNRLSYSNIRRLL